MHKRVQKSGTRSPVATHSSWHLNFAKISFYNARDDLKESLKKIYSSTINTLKSFAFSIRNVGIFI